MKYPKKWCFSSKFSKMLTKLNFQPENSIFKIFEKSFDNHSGAFVGCSRPSKLLGSSLDSLRLIYINFARKKFWSFLKFFWLEFSYFLRFWSFFDTPGERKILIFSKSKSLNETRINRGFTYAALAFSQTCLD